MSNGTPTPATIVDTCSTCFFWKNAGECHFDAPQPASSAQQLWPKVTGTDWCGDGISNVDSHRFSHKNDYTLMRLGI